MQSAVQQLTSIGCRASGIISDEDLVKAVQFETRGREYDEVILATGRQGGTQLARVLGWVLPSLRSPTRRALATRT